MPAVYLLVRELHSRKNGELLTWFPVAAFTGTEAGKAKANGMASDLNVKEARRQAGTYRYHHGSTDSRYWLDFDNPDIPEEQIVYVVRRVEKR